ncbi:GGDEF domain-containing protein [Desulfovibrio sp. JC010]|uniref:GGDEF domain-containing protein n=1 Tax=Desulfovibrio sp. JC010 TaxID=2593641 RepID=UPI0013D733F8|nr:GGDEF domain-containing protein [Desulfovibrio sp. JC010]NDV25611.1 GGDEF domain-containing protein [Desulfovibrio sp. JC010]
MLENTLFETHFNIIPFPIYVIDINSYEIVFCNSSFKAVFGDRTDNTCYEALYGHEAPCIDCRIPQLVDDKRGPNGLSLTVEKFNERNDRWYQLQEKALSWPDGRTVKHTIAVDITELKEVQNKLVEAHASLALKTRQLEHLAAHDNLTGVLNRLSLEKALHAEIDRTERYGREFSFVILDIDRFKSINDTFGHQVGDEVLVEFCRLLVENLRQSDLLGRWGGEEFVIICPETDLDAVLKMAEKLRSRVADHAFDGAGRVTASFGVTQFIAGDSQRSLMKRADDALYLAKKKGRNMVLEG